MIKSGEMKLIQIVLNNYCEHSCCHCSQLAPCQIKKWTMTLSEIENALISLEGYNGHIGFFGGNPLLHPQFDQACNLLEKYVPVKLRRELWCSGRNFAQYKTLIDETFYKEAVAYNNHEIRQECWHQPVHIAIDEVIEDSVLRNKIIDNCWVQLRWSASITPMGAYFCEVASARAFLFGKPQGLPVERQWWKRPLSDYQEQIDSLCRKCSACLPMPIKANDLQDYDDVSPEMFRKLTELGCPRKLKIYNIDELRQYYEGHVFEPETEYLKRGYFKDFPEWTPNLYRPFEEKKHCPEDADKA